MVDVPFPEPTTARASRADVLEKVDGPADDQLRGSILPSGWSPLALVRHLTWVERRWLVRGFAGEHLPDPWGDERAGRWTVDAAEPVADVLDALREQGERTRLVVASHELSDVGAPGERWDGAPPATLERVLLHLVQEYARHAGHLDVVRELIDGPQRRVRCPHPGQRTARSCGQVVRTCRSLPGVGVGVGAAGRRRRRGGGGSGRGR